MPLVNDVPSRLNPTRVARLARPRSPAEVAGEVQAACRRGEAVAVCGARHAMGGQQFASGAVLLDLTGLRRVRSLDRERGWITAEAGVTWPDLIAAYLRRQGGARRALWGIAQKQTGADRLTLGGAVAANVHGRGLALAPFVGDVEALELVDPRGEIVRCSRRERPELFRQVVGGYGLFGVVTTVVLRLSERRKLERVVEMRCAGGLVEACEERIAAGFLYGDFQFAIDARGDDFLRRGVFACYRPVDPSTPIPAGQRQLSSRDWRELVGLAHTDKRRAFALYAEHYLASAGQVYWSDLQQLGPYLDGYHAALDRRRGAPSSEMISELYVPRPALSGFLEDAARELRARRADLIYGTVRLIEEDAETALPWARGRWACVIFNLHTEHTAAALEATAEAFRALIDLARARGGSYYLTYHRWARADQVAACHPGILDFLRRKRAWDPEERFSSDWYRHHRALLAGEAAA